MKPFACHVFGGLLIATAFAVTAASSQNPDWSKPRQPFRLYGNTWYVGTQGLSAVLITSTKGHVLIDGTLASNASQIEAHVRTLGFHVRDIRAILNSHAHSDHAGAIAQLARDSGATVYASAEGAREMQAGGDDPDDPQHGLAPLYPRVSEVRVVTDGQVVHAGGMGIVAHRTPGHTPGSTSWTWRSCEGTSCHAMVYADSVTLMSRKGYRFTDDASHPHRVEDIRHGLATIAALPCDILITPHPDAVDLMDKIARRDRGVQPDPLIDTHACAAYAATGAANLAARLTREKAGNP
jgi:metallo-beta-lactamase class B